jgi:UMF1 family MFS transporter
VAPLIGAIADKGRARVRLLGLFTVLGAAMTAGLFFVAKGDWLTASILYILASLGFWGGNQFYDSLLTDVSEEREYDLVSGYGYALGYLGGGLLFALNVAMVLKPDLFGLADKATKPQPFAGRSSAWESGGPASLCLPCCLSKSAQMHPRCPRALRSRQVQRS